MSPVDRRLVDHNNNRLKLGSQCKPARGGATMPQAEDRRLVRLTKICLSLPEATRKLKGDHAGFRVKKKTFAYFLNNHHDDGIVAVSFKMTRGDNAKLTAPDPGRFYLPAYIGPQGWLGLRLDVGKVDWDEVADFVTDSYRLVAPKRLVTLIDVPQTGQDG